MGIVKTIKNKDGKPFVSLEDLIKEIELIKNNYKDEPESEDINFLDVVIKTFHQMEEEFYSKVFYK